MHERSRGSHLGAAAAYRQLEALEPEEPMWSKGLAESLDHHGDREGALAAYRRAAIGYAARGFALRAIAIHKMILRRSPNDQLALEALLELQARRTGASPLRGRRGTLDSPMHDEFTGVRPMPSAPGVYEIPLEATRGVTADGVFERETLATAPMFARLSTQSLRLVIEALRLVVLSPGQVLYQQGSKPDAMYMIADGRVALSAGGTTHQHTFTQLGPGDVVGVVGMCSGEPRPITAMACETTHVLEIPRSCLDALLVAAPELRDSLLDLARQRLLAILLETHRLFHRLDSNTREQLAARFRFFEVTEGAQLVEIGQPPGHLFVVMTGRLEIVGGDDEVVAAFGTGSLAAESEFIAGTPVVMPIVARRRAFVLGLPREDFAALANEHPQFFDDVLSEAAAPVWDPALVS